MDTFFAQLTQLMRHDPGGRGFAHHAPAPDLRALTARLMDCQRVVILTGFPILSVGRGETDGPPGAANLARALTALGKGVWVATDPPSLDMTRAACALYAPKAQVVCIPQEGARAAGIALLDTARPDLLMAIERPGQHGGHYHNARGVVIDHLVADTEVFFQRPAAPTVAIGDGGNELGMGSLAHITLAHVPGGAAIAADLGSDFPLAAGVSNWWGWGVAALLSVACGRELLPSDAEETALVAATVAAGAVDGVTGQPTCTVDGLSMEANLAVLAQIRGITRDALARRG